MKPSSLKAKAQLLEATAAMPSDSFFLEHSQTKEAAYINRSYSRWVETIRIAQSRVADATQLACLDIGTSPFTFMLPGVFKTVSTMDLSVAFQPRCEAAGIKFFSGGVDKPGAFDSVEKVDCVFFLEVLEHLHANPVEILRRIRSVLRPAAWLILSTPNMMCLGNRVRMLLNRKLNHFSYPPFAQDDRAHGHAHDRIYMPQELAEYFVASGFSEVDTAFQLHCGDEPEGEALWRSLRLLPTRLAKLCVPSLRDGIIMIGRNPSC